MQRASRKARTCLGVSERRGTENRECVVELFATFRDCDARHPPEPLALEVRVMIDGGPAILLTQELPDEVFGPAAGKEIYRVHQDALGTQQHRNSPRATV